MKRNYLVDRNNRFTFAIDMYIVKEICSGTSMMLRSVLGRMGYCLQ